MAYVPGTQTVRPCYKGHSYATVTVAIPLAAGRPWFPLEVPTHSNQFLFHESYCTGGQCLLKDCQLAYPNSQNRVVVRGSSCSMQT